VSVTIQVIVLIRGLGGLPATREREKEECRWSFGRRPAWLPRSHPRA